MFGFINIYKPKGMTSHDVVSYLRRITKIKQIGHTGTLDPFAEGVLPVCIGKATRLIEYLDDDKAYIGVIKLGESTTTYDTEGEVVETSDKPVMLEDIEKVIETFEGEIEQLPPIYSAIKVNGKKLYEYARNGESVEILPRKVNISKLEVLNYNSQKRELELSIECSKGTYIRSLANDIGKSLYTYGHLIKLIRVRAGKFYINQAVKLEELKNIDDVKANLKNPLDYLSYNVYEVNDSECRYIKNGISIEKAADDGRIVMVNGNSEIVAICSIRSNKAKPEKVFI